MQKDSYIQQLKNWFNDYVKTFYSDDAQTNHNIELKLKHTYRVCLEMDRLVEHLKQKLLRIPGKGSGMIFCSLFLGS
jgi:hypothetical protein